MVRSLCAGVVGACLVFGTVGAVTASLAQGWTAHVNPRFGFSLYYPTDLFKPGQELPEQMGHTFVSDSDGATIKVSGAFDEMRRGAKLLSGKLKETEPGAVSDLKVDEFAYSYTADRGDKLHFQRVVFTCREQIINTIELDYPKAEQERYKPIIEKLIQRFQAGQGYATPDNCL